MIIRLVLHWCRRGHKFWFFLPYQQRGAAIYESKTTTAVVKNCFLNAASFSISESLERQEKKSQFWLRMLVGHCPTAQLFWAAVQIKAALIEQHFCTHVNSNLDLNFGSNDDFVSYYYYARAGIAANKTQGGGGYLFNRQTRLS